MFGYLLPYKPEMKIKHYDLYRSVYCGLCKALGKQYGVLARLTLSYDCAVLAVLSLSLNCENLCMKRGRCVCNPLKSCVFCMGEAEGAFGISSAVSVIMSFYKLEDAIYDSRGFKRCAAKCLRLVFSRCHKKAAEDFPAVEELTKNMMARQREAESAGAGLDRSAQPTAEALGELCVLIGRQSSLRPVLKEFGYYIGRWIYLMDAADDLEKDRKNGDFNPFLSTEISAENTGDYCNGVLNACVNRAITAFDLLDLRGDFAAVMENILYDGMANVQKDCLYDKPKRKQQS